jgi:hypothetical protein
MHDFVMSSGLDVTRDKQGRKEKDMSHWQLTGLTDQRENSEDCIHKAFASHTHARWDNRILVDFQISSHRPPPVCVILMWQLSKAYSCWSKALKA